MIDNAGDAITESNSGGTDLVLTWITLTGLANNIENLTLLGSANVDANGNTLANTLTGNSGNNVLDGKSGKDKMLGGAGDDTYIVDSTGDVITENTNEGTDTVQSAVSFTLGNNIENLTLLRSLSIDATGNSLANILTGSDGNNTLNGGNGNDILIGGAGVDQMSGGSGADTFKFTTLTDSGTGTDRDIVMDFTSAGDKINVSGIDAKTSTSKNDTFVWKGTAAFSGVGELRISTMV